MIKEYTLTHDEVMAALADAIYQKVNQIDVLPKGDDVVVSIWEGREVSLDIDDVRKEHFSITASVMIDTEEDD